MAFFILVWEEIKWTVTGLLHGLYLWGKKRGSTFNVTTRLKVYG